VKIFVLRFLPNWEGVDWEGVANGNRVVPGIKAYWYGEDEKDEGRFFLCEPLKKGAVNIVVVVVPLPSGKLLKAATFLTLPHDFPDEFLESKKALFLKDANIYEEAALKLADKLYGKFAAHPLAIHKTGVFVNDPQGFHEKYNKVSPRTWCNATRDLSIVLSWHSWMIKNLNAPQAIMDLKADTRFEVERTHLHKIRERYGLPKLREDREEDINLRLSK
jgi:hypothetical protein